MSLFGAAPTAAGLVALALSACAVPPMDVQTPFGSLRTSGPPPPLPPADGCRLGDVVLPTGSTLACGQPSTPRDTRPRKAGVDPADGVSSPPSAGESTPASGLRDLLSRAEGGPLLEEKAGHICNGHWITPDERAAGRFARQPLTEAECDELLDEDVAEARGEAERVFGTTADGVARLCFWRPCARLFGGTALADLPAAVEAHPHLGFSAERMADDSFRRAVRARALRIAAAIRQG